MFFYLYDAVVLDKKYSSLLDRVESRVIELGINGRVERLSPLRNLKELISQAVKSDAHTIVVFGSDSTFLHAMQVVAHHDITLGFLPFGESQLGPLFGMLDPVEGCNNLSRRITKQLSLGKANQTFFLSVVTAQLPRGTRLRCNDQWTVVTQADTTECTLLNTGLLEVTLQPQLAAKGFLRKATPAHSTKLTVTKVHLEHPDNILPVLLDHTTTLKTPITFSIKPKAIKVIVGKYRQV